MNKILSWGMVILLMGLIFYLSHQPASVSNGLSKGLTEEIVETVETFAPNTEFEIDSSNHLVRKNAHFFVYFIFSVFVLHALKRSGISTGRSVVLALFICMVFAVSDEIHQLFVSGRGAEIKDVLIDTAGACGGIGMYWGMGMVFRDV